MGFKEQLATDAANVFFNEDEFAETVLFTPQGGLSVYAKAIITYDAEPTNARGGTATEAMISFPVAIVGNPVYGDSVMVGAEYWKVINQVSRDAAVVVLSIRKERSEKASYK